MRRDVLLEIESKIPVTESSNLAEALPDLDVIYMTRIQKERFADLAEYEKLKGSYMLGLPELASAKKDAIVMHPLPRVDEINPDVDSTGHAKYFKQAWYGVLTRMTLISLVLGALS
jgi:aspartate carbamoyltransferase catalytic subunit